MKQDPSGKPSLPEPREPRPAHDASSFPSIDDTVLRNYLADALPPSESARVEKALRDSAQLRERLEEVRNNRDDFQLHSLGAIWQRSRLTCLSRQQLGSFLLDALDEEFASYIRFHIDVIGCAICHANLNDLEHRQAGPPSSSAKAREKRILEATKEMLGEDERRRK